MKSFIKHESFYLCDCGYEGLMLRQYQYSSKDKTVVDPQVEFAVFSQSCRCKTWKEQLRWIWHIICNKQVWADQTILNKTEMVRLGKTLLSLAAEIKEK